MFEGNFILLLLSLGAIPPFLFIFFTYIKKKCITYIILAFLILFSIFFDLNYDNTSDLLNNNSTIQIIFYSKIIFAIISFICSIIGIFYLGTNKFKIFAIIFLILGIPNLIFMLISFLDRTKIYKFKKL